MSYPPTVVRKFSFPIILLLLFWLFVSLRGQSDQSPELLLVAATPVETSGNLTEPSIVASTTERLNIAGLMNDYLAVFGILVASVILALRRRAHLVFGQGHRRR